VSLKACRHWFFLHCYLWRLCNSYLKEFLGELIKIWWLDKVLSYVWVTIDRFWIDDLIYWPLVHITWTTSNYNSLTGLHTLKITVTAAHIKSSVFTSHLLVMDLDSVLCLCPYHLANILQLTHFSNLVPPRLAAISHQPSTLLFTDSSAWSPFTNSPGCNILAQTAQKTLFLCCCSVVAY
jgi:hypothetical protein